MSFIVMSEGGKPSWHTLDAKTGKVTTVFGPTAAPAWNAIPARPQSGYTLTFGKHKGAPIHEVPESYLKWCLGNLSNLGDELRAEIEIQLGLEPGSTKAAPEEEIRQLRCQVEKLKAEYATVESNWDYERRSHLVTGQQLARAKAEVEDLKRQGRGKPSSRTSPKVEELRGIVKQWFRALSLRFHPDRGGSTEQSVVVNECYRSLMEKVEQWERS